MLFINLFSLFKQVFTGKRNKFVSKRVAAAKKIKKMAIDQVIRNGKSYTKIAPTPRKSRGK